MEATTTNTHKNLGAFIHLSTFLKYFFPFANFFAPLLLWTFNKENEFVDHHGKQAINFQLSLFVYTLLIGLLCLPFFLLFVTDFVSLIDAVEHTARDIHFSDIRNLSGYILLFFLIVLLLFGLFVLELYAVISATLRAAQGEEYKYPLCIPFIKTTPRASSGQNQSNNEHTS